MSNAFSGVSWCVAFLQASHARLSRLTRERMRLAVNTIMCGAVTAVILTWLWRWFKAELPEAKFENDPTLFISRENLDPVKEQQITEEVDPVGLLPLHIAEVLGAIKMLPVSQELCRLEEKLGDLKSMNLKDAAS
eukprot:gnl/MRDRNA2_/MRDRNA2_66985_c0_seq1.p1 gnl/MRDRNA2_/MRDRNA2_66985_c0~~gnl/MRDRNA2_/MRDRNA2_66985_c0_seq1.p1  ORF type:complete len:135 (-),score=26.35 gnl/MRDRNA2_/MRDRNA2_66985_c0_seq1:168-572(-)